eukprot:16932-Heterococcus_DN1.PRE.2
MIAAPVSTAVFTVYMDLLIVSAAPCCKLITPPSTAAFRTKNSYSIERRPIDYVPTATLGSCCGRVPAARAASSSSLS